MVQDTRAGATIVSRARIPRASAVGVRQVTTAGGRIGNLNLGYQYIETLSKVLFNIPDVLCISTEGLDIDGSDMEAILEDAKRRINQII